jgi:hypothetical protein
MLNDVTPSDGLWPSLLAALQRAGFRPVPSHRPLDGRIADRRFDPDTGAMRPVTDYEVVGGILGAGMAAQRAALGRRVRPTWRFTAAGVALRFNAAWEACRHRGLQYAHPCPACGVRRWTNADRPPARCGDCRGERSPRCPETGWACSTAYVRHRCRCAACRGWNAAARRRQRARHRSGCDNCVSPIGTRRGEEEQEKETSPSLTYNRVVTSRSLTPSSPEMPSEPTTWRWVPQAVRAVVARYEAAEATVRAALSGGEDHQPRVAARRVLWGMSSRVERIV